jgi:hypothetical protein
MTLPPFPRKGFGRTFSVLTVLAIAVSLQSNRGWIAILTGSVALSLVVSGLGAVTWMLLSVPVIEARIKGMPAWEAIILVVGGLAVVVGEQMIAKGATPGVQWLGAIVFFTMTFALPVFVLRRFQLNHPGVGAEITRGLWSRR